jgi:hypothetical protein
VDCFLTHLECSKSIHVIAVEVSGVTIVNVYKPPSSNWSSNTLKVFPHSKIFVGDFNSHNQLWSFEHNNTYGNCLLEWITQDKGTYHLARWRKDYYRDLSTITQDPEGDDITTTRHISNGFPRNQDRPVFQHYGLRIPLTRSIPKHRCNFS